MSLIKPTNENILIKVSKLDYRFATILSYNDDITVYVLIF